MALDAGVSLPRTSWPTVVTVLTPQGSLSLGRRVHLWVGGAGWGPGFPAPGGWRTPRTHFQGHSPGLWVTEKPGIPPPPAHPPCLLPASVTHHCCHGNPASRAHDFRADGEELGLAARSCSKGLGQLAKWQRKRGSRLAGAAPCSKTRGGPRPPWGAEGRVGGAPRLPDGGGRGPRQPGLAVGASVSLSPKQDRPQTACVCVSSICWEQGYNFTSSWSLCPGALIGWAASGEPVTWAPPVSTNWGLPDTCSAPGVAMGTGRRGACGHTCLSVSAGAVATAELSTRARRGGPDRCPLPHWERKEAFFCSPPIPHLRDRDSGSFPQFPTKDTEARRKEFTCVRPPSPRKVPELVRVGVGAGGPQESRRHPCPVEPWPSTLHPARGRRRLRIRCIRREDSATWLPQFGALRPSALLIGSGVSWLPPPQLHSGTPPAPTPPHPCLQATGPPAQQGKEKQGRPAPRMDSEPTGGQREGPQPFSTQQPRAQSWPEQSGPRGPGLCELEGGCRRGWVPAAPVPPGQRLPSPRGAAVPPACPSRAASAFTLSPTWHTSHSASGETEA